MLGNTPHENSPEPRRIVIEGAAWSIPVLTSAGEHATAEEPVTARCSAKRDAA